MRIRTARSSGTTKILPSPTSPVRAPALIASIGGLHELLVDGDLEANLVGEPHLDCRAAVGLDAVELAAVALDSAHRDPADLGAVERLQNVVRLLRPDDSDHELHVPIPLSVDVADSRRPSAREPNARRGSRSSAMPLVAEVSRALKANLEGCDRRLRPLQGRRSASRTGRSRSRRRPRARRRAAATGEFVWIGMHDPEPGDLATLQEQFGLHELAIEDAERMHQRPKIEDYDESWFIVLRTAHYHEDTEIVHFGEVHVFAGPGYVITIRHGPGSPLNVARKRLEARPELLKLGAASAVWAIIDKVVDDYLPVVDGIEDDIEEVEADVFDDEHPAPTQRIYALKREVIEFHRAVWPLLAPADRARARCFHEDPRGAAPLLPRHRRPRAPRRRAGHIAARAADQRARGEPRSRQRQPGRDREEDLLGRRHHRRADLHRQRLRDELRVHARARPARSATRWRCWRCSSRCWASPTSSSASTGSKAPSFPGCSGSPSAASGRASYAC